MIEKAISALLSSYEELALQVGTRIYPSKRPQDSVRPALTFNRESGGTRDQTYTGPSGLAAPVFRICVWTADQPGGNLQAAEIAELIRKRLDGFHGYVAGVQIHRIALNDDPNIYDDVSEAYERAMDFRVWHAEARA